jgi:hypothetical protein
MGTNVNEFDLMTLFLAENQKHYQSMVRGNIPKGLKLE